MIVDNVIGFGPGELPKFFYRVEQFKYVLEMFSSRQIAMPKTTSWDDPFENALCKVRAKDLKNTNLNYSFDDVLDRWYGLCFTDRARETDATWRIYSPNKDRVRVTFKADVLFSALKKATGDFSNLACFVGKVDYVSESRLKELLESSMFATAVVFSRNNISAATYLLLKRDVFKHEEECRLLYNSLDGPDKPLHQFEIDPLSAVCEIVADPRMAEPEFITCRKELRRVGFTGTFRKSTLYDLPPLNVTIDPQLGTAP